MKNNSNDLVEIIRDSILTYIQISKDYATAYPDDKICVYDNADGLSIDGAKKNLARCFNQALDKYCTDTKEIIKVKSAMEQIMLVKKYIDLKLLFTNEFDDILHLVYEPFVELLDRYPTKFFKKLILYLKSDSLPVYVASSSKK